MIKILGLRMVQIKLFLLLVCLALVSACDQVQTPTYSLLAGGSLKLADLHGKVVFINYWAEWCRPCRIEIPELNRFAKEHAADVRVLSVNFDGAVGEELRGQVRALGIEFDTLLEDPRDYLAVTASGGLPETIVLNKMGEFVGVLVGPQTSDSLQGVLQSLQ